MTKILMGKIAVFSSIVKYDGHFARFKDKLTSSVSIVHMGCISAAHPKLEYHKFQWLCGTKYIITHRNYFPKYLVKLLADVRLYVLYYREM